jgi:hypothetical protein
VTQQFRQTLNPLTTSFIAQSINLGRTGQLAVRLLARNEGGPGTASNAYEVGDISIESYHQTEGDASEVYLYGSGWAGRYDVDGSVLDYLGLGSGTVFTTPDEIMASILTQELDLGVDNATFAVAFTYYGARSMRFGGGIGAGWAVERIEGRALLNDLSRQAMAILAPRFTGDFCLRPYRDDNEIANSFDVDTILWEDGGDPGKGGNPRSTFEALITDMQNVANRFEVHYKYNVASGKYDGLAYVDQDGTNVVDDYYVSSGELQARCVRSYNRYGKLEPMVIEAYWIYDQNVAQLLLRHMVHYFAEQRVRVQFETTMLAACLEVGTYINVTYPELPSKDNGQAYEVHSLQYLPIAGRVRLVASRPITRDNLILPRFTRAKYRIRVPDPATSEIATMPCRAKYRTPSAVLSINAVEEFWEFAPAGSLNLAYFEEWSA